MTRRRTAWLALGLLGCATVPARAQTGGQRAPVLVIPFEAATGESRLYWLREAAAVLVTDELNARGADAITRTERLQAFERLQVPRDASLSHATVIRIGQLVGAGRIVTGMLELDGDELGVRARAIRLDTGQLEAVATESGPLDELFQIFERIARRLAESSGASGGPLSIERPSPAAFESYIKGLVAETVATQLAFLEGALKLQPRYDEPRLALWEVHHEQGDHAAALLAVDAVADESPWRRHARFLAAISEILLERYEDAFDALRELLDEEPTPALYNNLGVIQVRRGSTDQTGTAVYYFSQAAGTDRIDPDYCFNLGYAYWLDRNLSAAMYWLREAVRRNPGDGDAHLVLGAALKAAGIEVEASREIDLAGRLALSVAEEDRSAAETGTDPLAGGLERLKTTSEKSQAHRVDLALIASEHRDARAVAAYHLEQGRRLFGEGRDREAAAELKRSVYLSPYEAEAHLLLGRIYLRTGRTREAVEALRISVWSDETAAAHVALGEALLQSRDEDGARLAAEAALALDPDAEGARELLAQLDAPREP